MIKKPVVVIGMGEMGAVFARGFLRSGRPVYPVVRNSDIASMAKEISAPELVLVAVAEHDLQDVLASMPENWRDRLVLLQNELLPADWERQAFENPTVISVWFEKKKGQDSKVIMASPVFGPHSQAVVDALASIGIACRALSSVDELLFELVVKNVYILTTNIAGLRTGGTVGELWRDHQAVARQVSHEVIQIQQALTGKAFDSDKLIAAMVKAFEGDLEHKCMGRSAPARLKRALEQAKKLGTSMEQLIDISATANT